VSDETAKALGTILGPTLAALLTGGALLFQNALNARREESRALELRREEHARAAAAARTEWAAAFQEVLVAALTCVKAWKYAQGPTFVDRALAAYDSWLAAFGRAQVATARLLMVEQDPWIRVTASALASSLEPVVKVEADGDRSTAATLEIGRLNSLYAAFLSFTKLISGTGTPEDLAKLVTEFEKGCSKTLLDDQKANVLGKMSGKAALGS
jgi:hypothetical protein